MSIWDLYSYDNEAERIIQMGGIGKMREKRNKEEAYSKLSHLYNAHADTMFDNTGLEMDFNDVDVMTKYDYNKKTFFSNLKEPDFSKTAIEKTVKPTVSVGNLFHSMGVRPLAKPKKVYRFKSINYETGAEVIVPQKEIEVVGENDNNYYYVTKNGILTVAKTEVSNSKLDSETLKNRYMMQMNKQAENLVKNRMQPKFETAEGVDFGKDIFSPGDAIDVAGEYLDEAGKKTKAFAYGIGDAILSPIEWAIDQVTKRAGTTKGGKGYATDEEYFKKVSGQLKNGKLPKKMMDEIDKKLKSKRAEYPVGYSEETDVMASGGNKEQIEMARERDDEKSLKFFMGKKENEELTTADNITEMAGEIVGILASLWLAGSIGGAVTKGLKLSGFLKRGAQAIITGGSYGLLEKLKEKDADAIDTLKGMLEESAFFFGGGEASRFAGKAIGPTKTLKKEIFKRGAKASAFGVGSLVSTPLADKDEQTPGAMAQKAAMGAAFELGGGLITKQGRKGITTKIARIRKVGDKKVVPKGTEFEKEFGLNQPMKGLTKRKKQEMADKAQETLLNKIGEKVVNKVGSGKPKNIVEHYNKKYNIAKGKTKIEGTLKGKANIARVEISKDKNGKDFLEVSYNPEKGENQIAGAIRHEIEHLRDVKSGYGAPKESEGIKGAKTLREFMAKPGHHKSMQNFEINYLEKAYEQEVSGAVKNLDIYKTNTIASKTTATDFKLLKNKKAYLEKKLNKGGLSKTRAKNIKNQIEQIKMQEERYRADIKLFSENKAFSNETIHTNNRELSSAANLPEYVPPKKTLKTKIVNLAESAYTRFLNRQHAIDKTGKYIKMTNQNYSSYHGTVEHISTSNLVSRGGNRIGNKSLKDVLIAPKGYQAEFESYLYHKAHVERMVQGKPILADANSKPLHIAETRKIIKDYEARYPKFKEAADDYYQFMDDFMKEWAVDGGLITREEYSILREMYPSYVPAFRNLGDFAALTAPRSVASNKIIKQAVGGTEPLTPLMESIPAYIQQVVRAERRNRIHSELLNGILKNPEKFKPYAEIYDPKKVRKEIGERLKDFGEGTEAEKSIAKINKLLIDEAQTKGRFAIVLANGEPLTMKINDTSLWKALVSLQQSGSSEKSLSEIFNKHITSKFKNLITVYNPFFAVRNIARDLPTAYIQGSVHRPDKFIANQFASAARVMTDVTKELSGKAPKDNLFQKFKALGGTSTNLTKVEKVLKDQGKVRQSMDKIFEFINTLGYISETVPRYAEFKATYKRGLKKGTPEMEVLREALYNSKEVTINFARGGDYTKAADRVIPYINAGMQGTDRLARSLITEGIAKGNFKPLFKALGILTLPTAVAHVVMKNWNPKNYDKLPDWVVDNHYVLPISDTGYIRIPKSRESAFIFSTMFDRMLRAVEGDKDAFKNIEFSGSFFNPIKEISKGGIVGPIIHVSTGGNKDYFGRDIEPLSARFNKASKRNIYKDTTSKLSKSLGPLLEKINISPAQSDYMIDSYLGIVGDIIQGFNEAQKTPAQKLKQMSGLFVDTKYSSKEIESQYNKKDEASRQLSDFEIEKGLDKFKKGLSDKGVKNKQDIDLEIRNFLSWDDYDKWIKLKEEKSKVNKEYTKWKDNK